MDALSRTASTESVQDLIMELNYYSPYPATTRLTRKTGWKATWIEEPRTPGEVMFSVGKTRTNTATIGSLITQIYQGPPAPARTWNEYQDLPEEHLHLLSKDTKVNRDTWFEASLTQVSRRLAEEATLQPLTQQIYIDGEMLLEDEGVTTSGFAEPNPERWRVIGEFTWLTYTMGLATTVVWREGRQPEGDRVPEADIFPFQNVREQDWTFPENLG